MGSLREKSTGRTRMLQPEHWVGRASGCSLVIAETFVSAQHAVLRWNGARWELRDLDSTNGTFVNGERIEPGHTYPLREGVAIAFGSNSCLWELREASPPLPMVVSGETVLPAEEGMLAIPSPAECRATIYRIRGNWLLERANRGAIGVQNGQSFELDGFSWTFLCPQEFASALEPAPSAVGDGPSIEEVALSFWVSGDQEEVHVELRCGNTWFDLGARPQHRLLLRLARQKLNDLHRGVPIERSGWLNWSDLLRAVGSASSNRLQVDVFRIRKQLAAIGVVDAANIVERQEDQLRIGTSNISVSTRA